MNLAPYLAWSCTLIFLRFSAQATVYYVSSTGQDSNSGVSVKDAWKTLDKVNQAALKPGDRLLFESGGFWNGQLKPQGSGDAGQPIVISSYGGVARPVLNIGKAEGAGVRLTNQSWWEINNLEITSGAPPEVGIGRQGIAAVIRGDNVHIQHLVVSNCYIHDVWGQLGGRGEYLGQNSCAKHSYTWARVMFGKQRVTTLSTVSPFWRRAMTS